MTYYIKTLIAPVNQQLLTTKNKLESYLALMVNQYLIGTNFTKLAQSTAKFRESLNFHKNKGLYGNLAVDAVSFNA